MSTTVSPAVRCGARERPYPELFARALRVARGVHELGATPGTRIAIVLRNDVAFLEISAGVRLAGAVPVPVNWHWQGAELEHLLRDSASRIVFVHEDLRAGVAAAALDGSTIITVPTDSEASDHPAAIEGGDELSYESWLAGLEPWDGAPQSAPMSMIYTSGTTGRPKGIRRAATTPEQDAAMAELFVTGMRLAPGMHTLVPAPLYHTAPNAHALFAAALGIDLTIMSRFEPQEFLRLVDAHKINHVQMVPTMFSRLLALPAAVRERYDISSLQTVVHAAAPCPVHVKRAMIDWLGPIVLEYYGGSESGMVVLCDSEEWLAHPGTVGRPIADAHVRIIDADGADAPTGQDGEVYVRPPSAWPDFTYEGAADKRAEIDLDGWLTLGDVGHLDADGFLFLTDRVKDMAIVGGVNVYPAEIEQCLMSLAGVRDVAVFGIPDEDLGEVLAAHIDIDPNTVLTEEDVRDHVRRHLAKYKVPRVVVFDDDLPREDSGKLFKRRLRDRYWQQRSRI